MNSETTENLTRTSVSGAKVMSKIIEYLDDKDIVLTRTSGSYDLEAEAETLRDVITKLNELNCNRCILDFRTSVVISKTMDCYCRPEIFKEFGLKRSVKMAIVLRELSDNSHFYETVCVNRGWDIRMFHDYDDAIDWLNEKWRTT